MGAKPPRKAQNGFHRRVGAEIIKWSLAANRAITEYRDAGRPPIELRHLRDFSEALARQQQVKEVSYAIVREAAGILFDREEAATADTGTAETGL